jgi:hypothetical protein
MYRCTLLFIVMFITAIMTAQEDTLSGKRQYKNVLRYNLSGPMVFGWDSYVIFGYERVLWKQHTISVNGGTVKFPKVIYIYTSIFDLNKDERNSGVHFSLDYRFYPRKDNKHAAPRGVYFGPYYSYNRFVRESEWTFKNNASRTVVSTVSNFVINTVGIQLGYQFILWKRVALDFVAVGPGCGFYNFEANIDANLNIEERSDLLDGMKQFVTQKFPGANFIFSDKQINASGIMKTTAAGYRYLVQVGFNF